MTIEEFAKKMNLDKETKEILGLFLSYRQQEASVIRAEGVHRARERGVKFGRPKLENPRLESICRRYLAGELSLDEAAQLSGVSRSTIWRRARENMKKKK